MGVFLSFLAIDSGFVALIFSDGCILVLAARSVEFWVKIFKLSVEQKNHRFSFAHGLINSKQCYIIIIFSVCFLLL